jgi:hypothetical protein
MIDQLSARRRVQPMHVDPNRLDIGAAAAVRLKTPESPVKIDGIFCFSGGRADAGIS